MKNMTHVVNFVKSAIEHNERTKELLITILNELEPMGQPTSLDPVRAITDIREMDSMQMIEKILKCKRDEHWANKRREFILGLRDSYNTHGRLTESQRFHLETTYSKWQNSES